MTNSLVSWRRVALAAAVACGAFAGMAGAELATTPGVKPPVATIPARPVHQNELRIQCWQEGRKIIDERDLRGLSINDATRRESVSLKGTGDETASVFLLPVADAVCLIQPAG